MAEIPTDVNAELLNRALGWCSDNWLTLVLTGEIIGAVLAIKVGNYKRGLGWLLAALATIWVGRYRDDRDLQVQQRPRERTILHL